MLFLRCIRIAPRRRPSQAHARRGMPGDAGRRRHRVRHDRARCPCGSAAPGCRGELSAGAGVRRAGLGADPREQRPR